MSEEQHEVLQNSSNAEYKENKHSQGSNAERDKEAYDTEECPLQGEDDGRKNRNLPLFHVQYIRLFT